MLELTTASVLYAASDESSDYAYKSDEDNDLRYGMATDMEL